MVASMMGQWEDRARQKDSLRVVKTQGSIQNDTLRPKTGINKIASARSKKDTLPQLTIKDYKIISFQRDTTYLDTTLTINKEYKYNYIRTDDFELMPFGNIGQTYNTLGYNFDRVTLYPKIGARGKHYNYWDTQDINYYRVPTPMTDILFKTTLEQGQLLDAMLTFNTSPRLNFSLGYKGHRSLGKYSFEQIQSGNFTTTTNYISKNNRYTLRAHMAAQDIKSEENGGLVNKELQFESGDPDFINRPRVEVRFDDANNVVLGKRYYMDHQYKLVRRLQDSTILEKTALTLGHMFNYETKFYQYLQESASSYYGGALLGAINDKSTLKTLHNQINLTLYNRTLGSLTGAVDVYNYNYFFNSVFTTVDGDRIQNQLKGTEISLGGTYKKTIKGFSLEGSLKYTLSGELTGNIFDASAGYVFTPDTRVEAKIHSSSRMPNFNFLLYQSEYLNYNWQNTSVFDKERVNSLEFNVHSKKWGQLRAQYSLLDNYTYFGLDSSATIEAGQENANIKPLQEAEGISHLKVKYMKELRFGKFALNNTIMYQNVGQDKNVINVPQLVTRNSLYLSSDVFDKAMFLQTGVTFKYFTAYNMNAYNPVLAEFFVQNREELVGFPMLDIFINAKVRQTRIFLKAEHVNSSFTGYNFYAAPNYPYRDFVIRFGLVWNFFS
jgi:hypothetical protein